MTNPVLETIFSRSSIRLFDGAPLTDEELEVLKRAAAAAPTARNLQKQYVRFIVCKEAQQLWMDAVIAFMENSGDPVLLQMRREKGDDIFYKAPVFVAICGEKAHPYAAMDAGICVQTLALAAKSIGLESCIMGMPVMGFAVKGEELTKMLDLPEGYVFLVGLAVGHPAMEKAPHELCFDKMTVI